jgi:drug/metabolite transporter (DMT)-like permease
MQGGGTRSGATAALTAAALVAFASNSILCRLALHRELADPVSFASLRLCSGAVALGLLMLFTLRGERMGGSFLAAAALFAYAAPFTYAYTRLTAGTGALLLFGSVQATMLGRDLVRGARPSTSELVGLAMAVGGLIGLVAPGLSSPDPLGALLSIVAGIAWGVYSLLGRGVTRPLAATTGNFVRSLVFVPVLWLVARPDVRLGAPGAALAVASGALASGVGYAVWYAALRGLSATQAAILQLLVPVLAAVAGVVILGEDVSVRLVLSAVVILAGVALAIAGPRRR